MRSVRLWLFALLAGSAVVAGPMPEALAQPVGLDLNRDCQVLLTCRFTRGGVYQGCLSSYSCRVCGLVPSRCRIDPTSRVCLRMRCTWG